MGRISGYTLIVGDDNRINNHNERGTPEMTRYDILLERLEREIEEIHTIAHQNQILPNHNQIKIRALNGAASAAFNTMDQFKTACQKKSLVDTHLMLIGWQQTLFMRGVRSARAFPCNDEMITCFALADRTMHLLLEFSDILTAEA